MSKNTRNRILLTALAALLLVTLAVGGTMAWLVDTTGPVENTFTAAGIDIDLTETKGLNAEGKWTMQMIPGTSKDKNPIVSVIRDTTDVDIYLFVKFENSAPANLTYTSNLDGDKNGWTQGKGTDGVPTNVWYRTVAKSETTTCGVTDCDVTNPHWHLLAGDTVSVANTVEKDDTTNSIAGGSMKWTAYAIQTANGNGTTFDVGDAWKEIGVQ